jgi:hypothetical protein
MTGYRHCVRYKIRPTNLLNWRQNNSCYILEHIIFWLSELFELCAWARNEGHDCPFHWCDTFKVCTTLSCNIALPTLHKASLCHWLLHGLNSCIHSTDPSEQFTLRRETIIIAIKDEPLGDQKIWASEVRLQGRALLRLVCLRNLNPGVHLCWYHTSYASWNNISWTIVSLLHSKLKTKARRQQLTTPR